MGAPFEVVFPHQLVTGSANTQPPGCLHRPSASLGCCHHLSHELCVFLLSVLVLVKVYLCYSLQVLVLALLLYFCHLIFMTLSYVISLFTLTSQLQVVLITSSQLLDLFHLINFTCSQLLSMCFQFLITTLYLFRIDGGIF